MKNTGLAYMIMEAGKSQILHVDQQAEDLIQPMVQIKPKCILLENFIFLREVGLFILCRPSASWVWPTHIMVDNLPYSKLTDLKLISSKNTLQVDTYNGPP